MPKYSFNSITQVSYLPRAIKELKKISINTRKTISREGDDFYINSTNGSKVRVPPFDPTDIDADYSLASLLIDQNADSVNDLDNKAIFVNSRIINFAQNKKQERWGPGIYYTDLDKQFRVLFAWLGEEDNYKTALVLAFSDHSKREQSTFREIARKLDPEKVNDLI
jgi:hypothetical protein